MELGHGDAPNITVRAPRHWTSGRTEKPFVVELSSEDLEFQAISAYIHQHCSTPIPNFQILKILRNENITMYQRYQAYRESLPCGGNEKWLFHATRAAEAIVHQGDGMLLAYANRKFNAYGVGNYFAIDMCLPDFFAGGCAQHSRRLERRVVLLCRVALGACTLKERVLPGFPGNYHTEDEWIRELMKPEHQRPPRGSNSVHNPGKTEIVMFSDLHSFPAYIVEYQTSALAGDPYGSGLVGLVDISASLRSIVVKHGPACVLSLPELDAPASLPVGIYAMGGCDFSHSFSTVGCFDPLVGRWSTVAPMASKRWALAAVVLQGKIFALGGYDRSDYLSTVECFDPLVGRWSTVAPMASERCHLAAVVFPLTRSSG